MRDEGRESRVARSLVILSAKKLRKGVARREGEGAVGKGGVDLRERRESRVAHSFLGWLED